MTFVYMNMGVCSHWYATLRIYNTLLQRFALLDIRRNMRRNMRIGAAHAV